MSGIEVFTPLVREITIDGEKIVMGEFPARKFAAVQVASRPVLAALAKDFSGILAENKPDLIAFLVEATGRDAEWLDRRDPSALIDLLGIAMEVNADFSRRRIAPAFARLASIMAGIVAGVEADGALSSPNSGGSDTPSKQPLT